MIYVSLRHDRSGPPTNVAIVSAHGHCLPASAER